MPPETQRASSKGLGSGIRAVGRDGGRDNTQGLISASVRRPAGMGGGRKEARRGTAQGSRRVRGQPEGGTELPPAFKMEGVACKELRGLWQVGPGG